MRKSCLMSRFRRNSATSMGPESVMDHAPHSFWEGGACCTRGLVQGDQCGMLGIHANNLGGNGYPVDASTAFAAIYGWVKAAGQRCKQVQSVT